MEPLATQVDLLPVPFPRQTQGLQTLCHDGRFDPGNIRKTMSNNEQNAAAQTPLWSERAEQGVLGSCLLDHTLIEDVRRQIADCDGIWFDLRHDVIWREMFELESRGASGSEDGLLLRVNTDAAFAERCGGTDYVMSLTDKVPSSLNLSLYLEELLEVWRLRSAARLLGHARERVLSRQGQAVEIMADVDRMLQGVQRQADEETLIDAKAGAVKLLALFDTYVRGIGIPGGIKSGLAYFDKMLGGFYPQEYCVLAGRPGTGKTSLVLNIIDHLVLHPTSEFRVPVALFSLEMTQPQIFLRWACQRARVNLQKFRTGYMEDQDFPKLANAGADLATAPLWIDDRSGMTVHEIRAKARRLVRDHGVKLIVVDYLQLIKATDNRANREQQVSEISAELLAMVKELNVPAIVLAQLNRQSEASDRGSSGPKLSDLRESGAVEQDAHNVTILWNPKPKSDDEEAKLEEWEQQYGGRNGDWADKIQWVRARVCKNRNGPTGDCDLIFRKAHMNFLDPNAK